jgi:hypothetical protein
MACLLNGDPFTIKITALISKLNCTDVVQRDEKDRSSLPHSLIAPAPRR